MDFCGHRDVCRRRSGLSAVGFRLVARARHDRAGRRAGGQPRAPGYDLPGAYVGYGVAALSLLALVGVLILARRVRRDLRAAMAVLVAGGVLVSPHALPADLVLVTIALAIWGNATWAEWLVLSVGAIIAAVVPAPVPTVVGVLLVAWLCLRVAGLSAWQRPQGQAPASAG